MDWVVYLPSHGHSFILPVCGADLTIGTSSNAAAQQQHNSSTTAVAAHVRLPDVVKQA